MSDYVKVVLDISNTNPPEQPDVIRCNGVDYFEVVQCKDCKYNPKSYGWVACPMTGTNTRKDGDYCSYGEKK